MGVVGTPGVGPALLAGVGVDVDPTVVEGPPGNRGVFFAHGLLPKACCQVPTFDEGVVFLGRGHHADIEIVDVKIVQFEDLLAYTTILVAHEGVIKCRDDLRFLTVFAVNLGPLDVGADHKSELGRLEAGRNRPKPLQLPWSVCVL